MRDPHEYIWFVRAEPYIIGAVGVAGIAFLAASAWMALTILFGKKDENPR